MTKLRSTSKTVLLLCLLVSGRERTLPVCDAREPMKTTGKTYKEQPIYRLLSIAKGGKARPEDKMRAAEKLT